MSILEQCHVWAKSGQAEKIVDAIEALPIEARTPELDSELARAYNNMAGPNDRALYERAIALLLPHEAYFGDDLSWHVRLAYAFAQLDRFGEALPHFERALIHRPDDEGISAMIEDCRRKLSLPRFEANFCMRTATAWTVFAQREGELSALIDQSDQGAAEKTAKDICGEILALAFEDISFELGFSGEKYELMLTPKGVWPKLFQLVYFKNQAPADILEKWRFTVGRQAVKNTALQLTEQRLFLTDATVWAENIDERSVSLAVFCEPLAALHGVDHDQAWRWLFTWIIQLLGEIPAMAYIEGVEVLAHPRASEGFSLADLPDALAKMGFSMQLSADACLEENYSGYQSDPTDDPTAPWRSDIFAGVTRCPVLIDEYWQQTSMTMDALHREGVVAGFLFYPLDGFSGEEGSKQALDFRGELAAYVQEQAGPDAVTLIGAASGVFY